jgi:hypothetical protein
MAHDKKSSIRAVYNHAQHLKERRKIMQVWADFLDLLRDTGEIVDFQTARQQIESSLNNYQSDDLETIDKQDLIQALINKGMTKIELQKLLQ